MVLMASLVLGCSGATAPIGAADAASSDAGERSDAPGAGPREPPTPTSDACGRCAEIPVSRGGACYAAVSGCRADATCAAWLECSDECKGARFTRACFEDCAATYAAARGTFEPVLACVCARCAECAPACGG